MTLFFHIFQNFCKVFPYSLDRRDRKLFFCSMDILHIRSQRYTVQSRDLLIEKTAFQPCMDDLYLRSGMEKFFINIYHIGAELGVLLILPGGIVSLCFVLPT